jgi:hypothetical protein
VLKIGKDFSQIYSCENGLRMKLFNLDHSSGLYAMLPEWGSYYSSVCLYRIRSVHEDGLLASGAMGAAGRIRFPQPKIII